MDNHQQVIDRFLQTVEVGVEAFGTCEIGADFSLRCAPSEGVIVHFVLAGEGFLECAHGRFPLSAGTVVIVPKKLAKSLSGTGPIVHISDAEPNCVASGELLRFCAFSGEPDLILGCAQLDSSSSGGLPLFERLTRPIIEKSNDPLLGILLSMMLDEFRTPRLGSRAFISALMKQVLIVVLRSQPNDDSSILLMSGTRLARSVAAILDQPGAKHTVDSLAALAGMSRSRFCDHFTAAYGTTPKAFVQTARLASAARMLKRSELPVKAIAASVGYASRSHFSRAFQEKFGTDPSAYRSAQASGELLPQ
ncbi:MAG: AraC family transcriptional regulator [Sphingomicrobium sp.]